MTEILDYLGLEDTYNNAIRLIALILIIPPTLMFMYFDIWRKVKLKLRQNKIKRNKFNNN